MWDKHWSRGASERVAAMVPRMNAVVKAARAKGVTIIHCPSETMPFYKDHPARKRMIDAPQAEMPKEAEHDDPPQPVDAVGRRFRYGRDTLVSGLDPAASGHRDRRAEGWDQR